MTRQEAIAGKAKLDRLITDTEDQINALQALGIHLQGRIDVQEQMRADLIYARQQYNRATEVLRNER
jgi:outer membrane lipopolysaccharide assembly protein LptE/RlpB